MTASASEIGIPIAAVSFANKSWSVTALASQKTKTSAAFACAASSNHRDQIMGATMVIYCRRLHSNLIYFPEARLVNISCIATFCHNGKSLGMQLKEFWQSMHWTWSFLHLPGSAWGKHGSRAFAAVQCVPKQVFPMFCKDLTGSSSPTKFHSFQSKAVERPDLLTCLILPFRIDKLDNLFCQHQFQFDSNSLPNKSPACQTLYLIVSEMQSFEATCWLPKSK